MQTRPARIAKTAEAIRFAISYIEAEEDLSDEDIEMIRQIRAGLENGEIIEQARTWLYSVAEDVGCYDGTTDASLDLLDHLTNALTAR
jgi:hypothetical protein